MQDKLWLPGLMKLKLLIDSGFFGRILSVRGEFGYWVFEGDWQTAQRPSWNYRKEDDGGIIVDMLCHWRYVLDNLFGDVKAVSCLGATHIPQRVDERGRPYAATADDAAYATFELEGGVIAQINSSWTTRVRRDDLATFHVDGTLGSAVAGLSRLLDPAARGHAEARLEPGRRADARLLRLVAEDAVEPELRQRVQGAVGAVPRPRRGRHAVPLEPARGREGRAARRTRPAELGRTQVGGRAAPRRLAMTAPDPSLLSLNTATVRAQWTMDQIVEGCARHGIRGISPWRDQVANAGLIATAQRVREHGLVVTGYCRGGMFPAVDAAGRRAARDDNRRAVDEALALGARCLVLVVGGLPKDAAGRPVSKDLAGARAMVRDGIAELLEYARPAGMPLAIEPLHPMYAADRACINTLAQANDVCDELAPEDDGSLGVVIDVYHLWWDPHLAREIARAGAHKRLLAHHLCDWLVPTTDLLNDRGMMGDGVIDLPRIRQWMEAAGYRGFHEVEIFSARWWKTDPDVVLDTCIRRYRDVT